MCTNRILMNEPMERSKKRLDCVLFVFILSFFLIQMRAQSENLLRFDVFRLQVNKVNLMHQLHLLYFQASASSECVVTLVKVKGPRVERFGWHCLTGFPPVLQRMACPPTRCSVAPLFPVVPARRARGRGRCGTSTCWRRRLRVLGRRRFLIRRSVTHVVS